ncbi:dTMP kinase [Kamptonema cortianum]|nr:dTMP kinase [Geitlerinema splendidum]MDK3156952.1 dTMP kinase [Kamptonema cortianum]
MQMFVTFEGPEGAGKSSVIAGIRAALESEGRSVLVTREPGGGEFGAKVRRMLLDEEDMPALSEVFLFLADRANHMERIILPALAEGQVVLCDRHAESTIVYQGYARGLDIEWLRDANLRATGGKRPDLIFLIDIEPSIGLARISEKNRLDAQPLEFHKRVREGYLAEMKKEPSTWFKVDGSQTPRRVLDDCLAELLRRLG